ncbi:MAG: hypothetical protein CSA62_02860 [Planctomycetota bacterium]|nr:MAG: hypothetical protein CSA62_02860 [Planctomycetota bacterium]
MDANTLLAISLHSLHFLSFATLLGAVVYVRFFVTPKLAEEPEGPQLFLEMNSKGARWIYAAIGLALLSGLGQYYMRRNLISHPLVGSKILLALAAFAFISMVFRSKGQPQAIAVVQKHANIALLLMLFVVILASIATN